MSAGVDFAEVARACGYARVARGASPEDVEAFLTAPPASGPGLLHVKIATGTIDDLPRPAITPADVLRRLEAHLRT